MATTPVPDPYRLCEKRVLTYWTCYCIYHTHHKTKAEAQKCIRETDAEDRAKKDRNNARGKAYREWKKAAEAKQGWAD